jgi:hypothetical protein
MKLKALLLAVLVAGLGASFALADDGGTAGTTASTSTGTTPQRDCRRVELKGTFVSAAASSFVVDVAQASHAAKTLRGTKATVAVDAGTRVRWESVGSLAGPQAGDRVHVLARQCASAQDALVAVRVDARPAKADRAAAKAAKQAARAAKEVDRAAKQAERAAKQVERAAKAAARSGQHGEHAEKHPAKHPSK